jgi:aryl-alcohol dehydrogenase-like predicted oxidoreductase
VGRATPDGTRAYIAERQARGVALAGDAFRPLGRTGLSVSRIGYGTYRVFEDVEEHARTLLYAILHGTNLVDTSTNYTNGSSETLVGNVLRALVESGGAAREQVVIVTKAGYVQGANHTLLAQRERDGKPMEEVVRYGEGLWHCIHPDWLEEEIGRSLERLGVDALDVFLLHNPEYYLAHERRKRSGRDIADVRRTFYNRVTRAFARLEEVAGDGHIGFYGVSSNTLPAGVEHPDHVSLTLLLECARDAARAVHGRPDMHRFAVVQLPFNLYEAGAFAEPDAADGRPVLEVAREAEIAVLANRPLNAWDGARLVRLAQYDSSPEPDDPASAIDGLASVEGEISRQLRAWRLWDTLAVSSPTDLFFNIAETARSELSRLGGRPEWIEAFERVLAPSIVASTAHVATAISDDRREAWAGLIRAYQQALQRFATALTDRVNRIETEAKEPLRTALAASLGDAAKGLTLGQMALHAVASVPGVTAVLCGMKRDAYVLEGTALLRLPDFPEPYAAFRAAAAAAAQT